MEAYPWIDVYSQRKAETPEASPIFASGMLSSSTRAAIDFVASIEQEDGIDESRSPRWPSASLILPIGHENSNAKSLRWSFKVSSSSVEQKRIKVNKKSSKLIKTKSTNRKDYLEKFNYMMINVQVHTQLVYFSASKLIANSNECYANIPFLNSKKEKRWPF